MRAEKSGTLIIHEH